jgi:4-hydroxybenzoate polyprenyltransferase
VAKTFAQLTRLEAASFVYLAFVLPMIHSGQEALYAFTRALPPALICMCGFIINNLYDLERDKQNHPGRPLPGGRITPLSACVIYFLLLAIVLAQVRLYATERNIFLYLFLLLSAINYNVVIQYVPYSKNLYVAAVAAASIFLLATLTGAPDVRLYVAGAAFFYFLGKEMLMDILDAKGDGLTFAKLVGLKRAANIAFGFKFGADALLLFYSSEGAALFLATCTFLSDAVVMMLWKLSTQKRAAVLLMRLQGITGIYFLL